MKHCGLRNLGIDHGGLDGIVPQKFLDDPYLDTFFQKMGSITVPKGMCRDMHMYLGPFAADFNNLLKLDEVYFPPFCPSNK